MRPRTPHLLITFRTTAQAMAMERSAAAHALPGRLIPIPGSVRAGCGLGWCALPEDRSALLSLMEAESLAYEAICEVLLR